MPDRTAATIARTVRAAVRRVAKPAPDADLLAAFARTRDPAAFEGLVRRHGPLVLAACRAILSNPADADDACQAAFVVLHRKAATVRDGRTLGGWLFRVARRAALEVKAAAARRHDREKRAARPEPVGGPDLSWREACAVLHEELDRLPPRYRLPLILCYLDGKTQDEAAAELGWTADSVRGRIHRGRDQLRKRLEKRGITLSAGLLAAVAVPPAVSTDWLGRMTATPSPAVSAAAGVAAESAGRLWSGVSLVAVAAALFVGTVLLDAAGGPDPKPPAARPPEPEAVKRFDAFGDPLPPGAVARLGTVRFNHGDGMAALQFSPDGKWVMSSGRGNARVWDAANGKELRLFTTGKVAYHDRAGLTADGRVLLPEEVGGRETIHVWDVAGGAEVKAVKAPWPGDTWGRHTLFSPNGRLAARLDHDTVPVLDLDDGRVRHTLKPEGGAKVVSFAGDKLLVTVDGKRQVGVWEADTGKPVRQFDHGGPAVVVATSADGRLLATLEHHTGAIDKFLDKDVVHVWDLTTGTRKHTLAARPERWFMGACLSPDGKRLAAVAWAKSAPELLVWDTDTGELVHEAPTVFGNLMAFSPDGRRLAIGLAWGRFELLDLGAGRVVKLGDGRYTAASAVALSPDGARASVTGYDSVSTWDAATGRRLTAHDLPPFGSMHPIRRYSPDGRYTTTYEGDYQAGRLVVREAATGKAVLTVDPGTTEVAFSTDSRRIAVPYWDAAAKASSVRIYDLGSGAVVHTVPRTKPEWIKYLGLSADGQTLIACGDRVAGYSVPDGREVFAWRIPRAVVKDRLVTSGLNEETQPPWRVFTTSPDGSMAAGLREFEDFGRNTLPERLLICDARTGQVIHRCSDSGRKGSNWGVVRFSPDNRLLASSDEYTVHVWEAATGRLIRTLAGHRGEIADLSFSGNGRRLASASYDSTVLIWDLSAPPKDYPADGWTDLAGANAATAWSAVWHLADAPDAGTIPLLRKHVKPVTTAESERIGKLVARLDSDEFRVRERALKELTDLGHAARTALRAAREKKPSAEAAARLDQLLSKLVGPPSAGESLRTWRAVAVLEAKGTAEANALLRELADGADGWLTAEARAALKRMER